MSITEAHALGELYARGPITQQQLAASLRLQKSTVSRLVDQLTDGDLVARASNPADRRSFLVALTASGAKRARRLEDARRDLFDRLLERLTPSDRQVVIDGMTRLEHAADALD
jgi:DNA-binding MarR family transcriptional regulator